MLNNKIKYELNNISVNTIFFFLMKIWIFTNIISSLLFVAINSYSVDDTMSYTKILFEKEFWQNVFFVVFFGLIYSVPAMMILGFIIKLWTNNNLILTFLAVFLVIGTFYFTGTMELKNPKIHIPTPPLIYSVVISFLIFSVKIKKED